MASLLNYLNSANNPFDLGLLDLVSKLRHQSHRSRSLFHVIIPYYHWMGDTVSHVNLLPSNGTEVFSLKELNSGKRKGKQRWGFFFFLKGIDIWQKRVMNYVMEVKENLKFFKVWVETHIHHRNTCFRKVNSHSEFKVSTALSYTICNCHFTFNITKLFLLF